MAPPNKKRKQQSAVGPNAKRSKGKGGKASVPRQRVEDAGSLAWQTFGEEFGVLEVIDGVDVVKEGDRVSFVVADTPAGKAAVAKDQEDDGDDSEEFEGFGDDDADNDVNTETNEASTTDATAKTQDAKKKSEKKTKKKMAVPNAQDHKLEAQTGKKQKKSAQSNSFGALMNANDDDDNDLNLENWVALNLSPATVSAIGKLGFANPTEIQDQSIPHIMAGADVIGKAQTGSGKTLAFGIPIVERWLELYRGDDATQEEDGEQRQAKRKGPTAVVLSPTRELAKQIGDHIKALCDGLPTAPYVCVVTGGLSIQKQQRQLEKADIVIGTPGRLWEVLDGDMKLQNEFKRIRFLVVDEADRLFKVGQFKEAELIIGALDGRDPEVDSEDSEDEEDDDEDDEDGDGPRSTRQTLVFSATFDKDLQTKLAGKKRPSAQGTDEEKMAYLMKCLKFRGQPEFIDVNPASQMATGLREGLIECGAMEKDLYLYSVLFLNPGRRTLVFTNSISAVRRVAPFLQNLNMAAQPIHSQMAQKARMRSLERFTATKGSILVATDVAARGLDIKEVDLVVHYHVPRSADTYVHRSGRTARGSRSGVSVLLCAPDEVLPTRRLAGKVHARRSGSSGSKREHFIETLPMDKQIVARLKPRADLSKKLADAVLAKEKAHSEDAWLRDAADELGVDYDEDEFDATASAGFRGGRGGGRKRKDKEAAALSKAEMGALRAQLREDLSRRVNLGVSERYIAGGRVDMAKLLREKEKATSVGGLFLGGDDSMGLGFGMRL
ncbi:DEAD-like helicase [Akanthomyces lecanii RCEF 1005]|uniref:RNA helicase n=1 Tax=Akanthomyces lecanii RCEF 1005 TaxID=1081108 RepID=A0A162KQR3_CORDF|nr:DEAD-like helicase [Akanthomyces lecanii RCEF 1005]